MEWISMKDVRPSFGQIVLCKCEGIKTPFVARFLNDSTFDAITEHLEAQSDYDYSGAEIIPAYDPKKITHWEYLPK